MYLFLRNYCLFWLFRNCIGLTLQLIYKGILPIEQVTYVQNPKGRKVHRLFSRVLQPPSSPLRSQTLLLVSPASFQIETIYCEANYASASASLACLGPFPGLVANFVFVLFVFFFLKRATRIVQVSEPLKPESASFQRQCLHIQACIGIYSIKIHKQQYIIFIVLCLASLHFIS